MSVARKTLEHPVLTLCVFVLLGVMSVFSLMNVQIDLMPEMEMPIAMVYTSYENAGPESVEKSVTSTLESALVSVSNLNELTSQSSEGSSMIMLEFNYGTDLDVAVNDIRDKLDMVTGSLPDDAGSPQIFKFSSSSMPIMRLAIRGNRTADELRRIADDDISPRLEQAAGVAQASVSGGRDGIVRVELSQNRLDAYGLTLSSIVSTLAQQNIEVGGGNVSEGTRKYMVRTTGEFESIDEINNTVVGTFNGYSVKLRDIGTAFMGYEDETSRVYINGQPGVYVSIQKQSGGNTVNVANAVHEKIAELEQILPSDVYIEVLRDDSEDVRDTLSELINSILQGFALAVIILFVFLRSFKGTVIMAISIPFSILLTLLIMSFAGITLNMITMTGLILGLGMVVDASVVVLENIYSYRDRGTKPLVAAAIGTQEVMASVVSGNLTTVCVFIPFFIYQSQLKMMGEMFTTLMIVIIVALLSSLIVAMFLVPVLAGKFLVVESHKSSPIKNRFLAFFDKLIAGAIDSMTEGYRKMLRVCLHHRFVTCTLSFGLLVLSVVLMTRLPMAFMPGFADTSVGLNVELPLGTKLDETQNVLDQFYEIIENEVQGYEHLVMSVGSGGIFSSDTSYKGSISIYLPEASKQIDTADDVRNKLRAHFDDYPTVTFTFDQGRSQQMSGDDIDILFQSDNLDLSRSLANELIDLMAEHVPVVTEPEIDLEEGLPQVEVKVDRDRASSFGISVMSIANEINYCINGTTATIYRDSETGDDYYVVVVLQDSDRSEIPDLEKIYVNGTGGRYSVANFAQIVRSTGPVSINRENQTRTIHLTANINGTVSAGEVENQIRAVMSDYMIIPENVTVVFDGSWQNTQETGRVFVLIFILAILLVFGVMAGTYESFKDPLINLATMPFMIVGVVVIYLITGEYFSMISMMGMVMLVGIVVNNGIILVDQTNLLVRRGTTVLEACERAGASRLRPILMTTLTTLLGMIPMAFFASDSASFTQPIGVCIVGGLTSSTLVTLFIIPVIYSLVNQKKDFTDSAPLPPDLAEQLASERAIIDARRKKKRGRKAREEQIDAESRAALAEAEAEKEPGEPPEPSPADELPQNEEKPSDGTRTNEDAENDKGGA